MKNPSGWPKSRGIVCFPAVAAMVLLPSLASGKAAELPNSVPQKASAAKPTAAIPLAEAAARGAEASDILTTLQTKLTPGSNIQEIQKHLLIFAALSLLFGALGRRLQPWEMEPSPQ